MNHPLLERLKAEPVPDLWPEIERRIRAGTRRRRPTVPHRLLTTVVALAVTIGALSGLWVAFHGPRRQPLGQPAVTATIRIPGGVTDLAFGAGSLWAPGRGVLRRIDPATYRIIATIPVPGNSDYRYVAVGAGAAWLTDTSQPYLFRIDPVTNRVAARIRVPCPVGVSVAGGYVWVTSDQPCGALPATRVLRIDPAANAIVGRPLEIGSMGLFVASGDQVWIANGDGTRLLRIDPASGRVVASIPFDPTFGAPIAADGSLWVSRNPFVLRLDPSTGRLQASISVLAPGPIAAGAGGVWVLFQPVPGEPGSVALIDPATNATVGRPTPVGTTPVAIVTGAGSVWVASFGGSSVTRIQLEAPAPRSTSPAEQAARVRFPGGGRILTLEDTPPGSLAWLSPDGSVQEIGRDFLSAQLPLGGSSRGPILAWKIVNESNEYYVMNGDGSGLRHLLAPRPMVGNVPPGYEDVQLSPDGSSLVYLRHLDSMVDPTRAHYELQVMDVTTRTSRDVGAVGPFTDCCYHLTWNGDSTRVLVQGPGGHSIEWFDVRSGASGAYLSITAELVAAYERAWPGAGPPTEIAPIGRSPDQRVGALAILASQGGGRRQAVILLQGKGAIAISPKDGRPHISFIWGPSGQYALFSHVGPVQAGGETGSLYTGNARSEELRHLLDVARLYWGPFFSPDGSALVLEGPDGEPWTFVSLRAGGPRVVRMPAPGIPLGWGP